MSLRAVSLIACIGLAACAAPPLAETPPQRRASVAAGDLPPMRVFAAPRVTRPARSNDDIAADFLDLSFRLESGRELPALTRFEGPVTLRLLGAAPAHLEADLDRLLTRLRREARIDIARVPAGESASITVQIVPRARLQRAVPEAACFVVPRTGSWDEFAARRRSGALDWATLRRRERLAIFIPGGVPPQELRDCLHEEVAQALGPLNDLYRLTDSVFNDDNFHTVLTGFDMLILRATYAPELRSGMDRDAAARALPGILARLNPRGARAGARRPAPTPRAWITQIERALGPRARISARRAAARRAVAIARAEGWDDTRLAFSLFALGRLSLGQDSQTALGAFLQAAALYARDPATAIHGAHIGMQLAAFALSAGQPRSAIAIVDANPAAVMAAENAALLSALLLVKSEALDRLDRIAEARRLRAEALGWARYGFGDAAEIRRRAAEIAAVAPPRREAAS